MGRYFRERALSTKMGSGRLGARVQKKNRYSRKVFDEEGNSEKRKKL